MDHPLEMAYDLKFTLLWERVASVFAFNVQFTLYIPFTEFLVDRGIAGVREMPYYN